MSEQEIKVPDLGGAEEVEVIEIIVSEGDSVAEEDPILAVESDKASVELPAPVAGKVTRITVKVGDKVREGDVIGMIVADGESAAQDDAAAEPRPPSRTPRLPSPRRRRRPPGVAAGRPSRCRPWTGLSRCR